MARGVFVMCNQLFRKSFTATILLTYKDYFEMLTIAGKNQKKRLELYSLLTVK